LTWTRTQPLTRVRPRVEQQHGVHLRWARASRAEATPSHTPRCRR
jgi:hypothetical protein